MQPKILSKRTMLLATLSGLILSVVILLSFTPKNAIQSSSTLFIESAVALSNQEEEEEEEEESIGLPVRLKIPIIQVNSAVIPVGLTSDGAMDVPKGPDEVAWFNLGSRPGESGAAVITGHYGWKNNMPAVFDNLHKLHIGDKVFVEDEKGAISTFVVREMRTYSKDEVAPDVFGSDDGKAHLNLITCTGAWSKQIGQYAERLVVFTDKE